jgi:small subunit ribosomal protein S6
MRIYELCYIAAADLPEDKRTELYGEVQTLVKEKGQILETREMGKRRLAFPIKKKVEGIYQVVYFSGPNDFLVRVETKLKQMDGVLRHLILRIDEAYRKNKIPLPGQKKEEA